MEGLKKLKDMEGLEKLKVDNEKKLLESRENTNRMRFQRIKENLENCKEENKKLILDLYEKGYFLEGSKLRTVSAASQMHLPRELKEKIMKAGKKRKSRRRRRRRTKKRKSKKRRKRKTKRKFR